MIARGLRRSRFVVAMAVVAALTVAALPVQASAPVTPYNLNGTWSLVIHHCNKAPFLLDRKVEISGWTAAGVSFTESIYVQRPGSHFVGDYVEASSTGYENSVGDVQISFLGKESETDVLGGTYSPKTTQTGTHIPSTTWQVPCSSGHGQDTVTMTNDHAE